MKNLFFMLAFFFTTYTLAQNWTGTYDTKYGQVTLVEEFGAEYGSDACIVYGDYGTNGMLVGVIKNNGRELHGTFFNGNQTGKFIWYKVGVFNNNQVSTINTFDGTYGYGNNANQYTSDADWKWTGKRISTTKPTNIANAVWSGKWTTSYGDLILEQVADKVTGKYKNVGNINATYDKNTKKLKGTFTNNGNIGYLEFTFEGNSFKGKWGWTASMTEKDVWSGNKKEKVNKNISTTNTTTNQISNTGQIKYRIALLTAISGEFNYLTKPQLYGFVSVKLYRVTNSNREEIKSFGNKSQYFFNTTENNAFPNHSYDFPINNVSYYREYMINTSDLNNPNVDIEIEIAQHLKGKITGENYDFKYYKEVLNLENIKLDKRENFKDNFWVGKSYSNGNYIPNNNNTKYSGVLLNLKKL